MGFFPNFYEIIDSLEFLRGVPAAYVVAVTALIVFIAGDWRITLAALLVQFLAAGLLFVDILDARLAVVILFVGLFDCLILYITARQVHWGRLPKDVSAAEAVQLKDERQIRFGAYILPSDSLFRVFFALVLGLALWALSEQPGFRLPVVPEHFNLPIFALAGLGLVSLSLTSEPLQAGMGMLMFLSGFQLLYAAMEQSAALIFILTLANMTTILVIAYLVKARHEFSELLD